MDRLTSMAVFVKAVDLGSFAAAATALGMSSPMVGKHVRSLEERLGVRLINRTTRSQKLTEFGRAYYERCRVVLAEVDSSDAIAADQRVELRGTLRVTMPALFGRYCVTPLLLEFAGHHPAVRLSLSLSDRVADLADEGFDFAIRTGVLPDTAGLVARRVASQRMIVCASPGYLSQHGHPAKLEDLVNHDGVIYGRSRACAPWLFPSEGGSPIEISPRVRLQIDDLDGLADAAVAGFGMAWLPSWLVRGRLEEGLLVSVFPNGPQHLFGVYATWIKTPYMPLRTRAAIDALTTALPRMMETR
jgi:DNA-binding transcriptional LysR family regulator